jgi:ribosomal protein S18 acetylase RimI-like enzyme
MDTDNISFSKMDVSDLTDILRISKDIILNTYVTFLGAETVNEYISTRQYEDEIVPNMADCMVMKAGEAIIGLSILLKNKLHLIMIDRKYQSMKYGSQLLEYAEGILFEDYSVIELQSFTGNVIANRFYEKNGWQKVEEIKLHGLSLFRYEKRRNDN